MKRRNFSKRVSGGIRSGLMDTPEKIRGRFVVNEYETRERQEGGGKVLAQYILHPTKGWRRESAQRFSP
jgi:hypothetical protein